MKETVPLLFLVFSPLLISAQTYYVATDGDDGNPGTFDEPWATLTRAFQVANDPGDTTYIRGGVYYMTARITNSGVAALNGTKANPICFLNYPGETPIFDGINKTYDSQGMMIAGANNVEFRGLVFRNHLQLQSGDDECSGIQIYLGNNITLRNCKVQNIGFRGYYFYGVDTLYVYNCDAIDVADTLSGTPGGHGDGFIMTGKPYSDTTEYAIFRGCRAYRVSDDGWDIHTYGYIELDSCWVFGKVQVWGVAPVTGSN